MAAESRFLFIFAMGLVAALIYFKRKSAAQCVREYFCGEGHPVNPALLRIFIFFVMTKLMSPEYVWFATIPAELRIPPAGYAWFFEWIPFDKDWMHWTWIVFMVSCAASCIGFMSRISMITAVVTGLYVLGVQHCFGKINHGIHHIIWFAALLAASPCADVLSVDAFIRRLRGGEDRRSSRGAGYALPIRFAWILMGILYFFPGFWKVWLGGDVWLWSDGLQHILLNNAFMKGYELPFGIDQYPHLMRAGAVLVIVFEMAFIFLIFSKRLRPLAAAGGILFHTLTEIFLHIPFTMLLWTYFIFIDWGRLFTKFDRRDAVEGSFKPRIRPVVLMGSFLVFANLYCGAGMIHSWPFSVFPTFRGSQGPLRSEIFFKSVSDGGEQPLDLKPLEAKFGWSRLRYLIFSIERSSDPERRSLLRPVLVRWFVSEGLVPEEAHALRVYRRTISILPSQREANPLKTELIYEFPLAK